MHAGAHGVDIAHLQPQPFAQSQPKAVKRKEEHPVAQDAGAGNQALDLRDGDGVGQALGFRRLDQAGRYPRLAQHMGVIEFEPV